MTTHKLLIVSILALGLAGCGQGEQGGAGDEAESRSSSGAETTASGAVTSEPAPPDPSEVMSSKDEQSREVWTSIQENHSELTDQQKRSLQACAMLAIRDKGAAVEKAVSQCFEKMKEMAEKEQQGESESGDNQSQDGNGGS